MEQPTLSRLSNEPIRLSALGREVKVGDLYNYHTDFIFPRSNIELLDENIDATPTSKDERFYFKPDDKLKLRMLGISSHFDHSINSGSVNESGLWFKDYLQKRSIDEDERNVAKIDVFFRFKRLTESINPKHFSNSKACEYQVTSRGRATHLVEQVDYGAEFIFSMQRAVIPHQTKENAERSLRLAVKAYVDEAINPISNLIWKQPPVELNNVICTRFCSLSENRDVKNPCSIQQSCEWLRKSVGLGENIEYKVKWRAVEIVLRNIPDQIGARVFLDMKNEFLLEKEWNRVQLLEIQNESFQISTCSYIDLVPESKLLIQEFLKLLPELEKRFNQFYEVDFSQLEFPEIVLSEMKEISYLFADIIVWLFKRVTEIEKIRSLLKDTQKNMLDLSEFEDRRLRGVQVCPSKKEFNQDPLLKRIKKFIKNQDLSSKLPVLPTSDVSENHVEKIVSKSPSCTRTRYLKELVPSSYLDNPGEIQFRKSNNINQQSQPLKTAYSIPSSSQSYRQQKNVDAGDKVSGPIESHQFIKEQYTAVKSGDTKEVRKVPINASHLKTEFLEEKSTKKSFQWICPIDQVDLLKESSYVLHSESQNNTATTQDCNLEVNLPPQSKKTFETAVDHIRNGQDSKIEEEKDNIFSKPETESKQSNPSVANSSCHPNENPTAVQVPAVDQRSIPIEQSVPEKKKIAEMFTKEEFSKLVKSGQPMVYQLNAKERSVGKSLQYFDITGRSDTASSPQDSQTHKVVILMGATGSGKSTLINGMVNYILGVQWKDPFRFKCVREDYSVVRNQAHSQTDSVMAYTLHHREGMTIPYSITIIDTPGYGDTRGIERDKEITDCIHRFLTQQQVQIDHIHAIGFVAASADSRLTPTQRYVLDSVLSIFGKNIKENIRLLVTFADNSIPPVVEACRSAHFPMTSPSAGVMYNKFNSSVLYASNDKYDTDDLSIDEIFWNMGQRNYKTFFTMLESMNGRDLKSTRQVIENRQLLEQSLQDIEAELEACFETIEKLENRSLNGNSSERKLTNVAKNFELRTVKAKVISLLDKVNKSGQFLDSVALLSHSPSAGDYLSLIRSRVIEEQRPGYLIRLQTLTELQNLVNENNLEGRQKLPAAMDTRPSTYSGDRASAPSSHYGIRNSKQNMFYDDGNPARPETFRQSSKSSRPAATAPTGPGQRTTTGKDNYFYFPSNTKVISVQPGLANIEDRGKDCVYTIDWNALSTVDKETDMDHSDQNMSEFNTKDTYRVYEKPSKKSDKQGKSSFLSRIFK